MPKINPRIKSIDDLLGLDATEESTVEPTPSVSLPTKNTIITLPPQAIRAFRGHPFRLYEGDRLNDLVESISEHGVLNPAIIRKIERDEDGFEYEMLAGHNRQNAAAIANRELPCIVKENLSDEDAWIYVIETNVLQRSFSEMLPSEKAAVLALRYSKMICQGRRNDIVEELKRLENPDEIRENGTCGSDFHKSKSREALGAEYNLIEILESFDEGTAAYFGKMLDWLENFIKSGVEEGRFSEKQAHQDLQIALWYAFACLNLDDYIHYYRAAEWMKDSEKNATGCATWYYRYSVALMYCGRLEEALEYAERGALEEPDYPWIWLHLGKLRAHFGDKSGALDAVKQGLKLEPGDYEFLTLKKEIKAGATLEQMEYHWINPDADQTLQRGLDENADDKQCAIACIRVDEAGLAEFYELFHPERYSYKKNSPCCEFQYPVKEHLVELSFRMNEAGLSKMGTDWLRQLKERLDSGEWLTHTPEGEPEGILTGVFVDQTRRIGLVYQQPGDDQYFQIFLNPDGTKADAFWSSRKNSEPEVYSEDEMSAIEQHIKNTFGEFENVFHELVSPDIHVDICVVPPSDERDYYTLVPSPLTVRATMTAS